MKHLIGIGNAAIDAVVNISEDEFQSMNLIRGNCVFVDDKSETLQSAIKNYPNRIECPGGASANAIASYAALGGQARFVGKTGKDDHAVIFRHAMTRHNVTYDTEPTDQSDTTFLFAFSTPDGERSFLSNHGSSHYVSPDDLKQVWFDKSTTLIIDGYMLMSDGGPATITHAIKLAQNAGSMIAYMPCDVTVLQAHPEKVSEIINASHALLCNESEAMEIAKATDLDGATQNLRTQFEWGVVTCGDMGARYFDQKNNLHVPIENTSITIDNTTGAGDSFAGGFLYGLHHDYTIEDAIRLGHRCAAHIIASPGAQPEKSLSHLRMDLDAA